MKLQTNEYRIKEESWYEYDKAQRRRLFYIQEKHAFLCFYWWRTIGVRGEGVVILPTAFDSFEKAEEFVEKLKQDSDKSSYVQYYGNGNRRAE